jgi:uncharacterized protein (DUF427 family)
MDLTAELPEENVWDYPRPPRLEPAGAEIVIVFGGVEIARSVRAFRVLETSHPPSYYLPRADIRADALAEAEGASWCEWKGRARYWDVTAGGRRAARAAWSYPEPAAAFAAIRDHVAFYPGPLDRASVGGMVVTPQPGGFYGGWITPNLRGPFKGGPGTAGW